MPWPVLRARQKLARADAITRGWAMVTATGLVRLGLGFVASLSIARALGPADFAVYAVLAALVGIAGSLVEGGLTEAAVLRLSAVWLEAESRAREPARAFFWLRLGLAAPAVAFGCVLAEPLGTRLLHVDPGLIRWALLGIVATAASGALGAMLQALGAFGRMSALTLVNAALTALLAGLLLMAQRLDLLAALVVLGIGTSLVTCAAGRALLPRSWNLQPPDLRALTDEAAHLLRTGRWLWLAGVFAMLTANAEVLLLNQRVSLPVLGAYALAVSLATRADLVNNSLYTVLLPGVARLREPAAVRTYVRAGLKRSGLIAMGLVLCIPLARPFIGLFYGPEYAPAVVFCQLLLAVMTFDVLLAPLLLLPLAYQRPRLLAAADALRAVTLVLVALLLLPIFGAFGAIAARFAARVAGASLVLGALWLGRAAFEIEHEEATAVPH